MLFLARIRYQEHVAALQREKAAVEAMRLQMHKRKERAEAKRQAKVARKAKAEADKKKAREEQEAREREMQEKAERDEAERRAREYEAEVDLVGKQFGCACIPHPCDFRRYCLRVVCRLQ
jgi:hypothetical protein